MEECRLTREQVEAAHRRGYLEHPVVGVLKRYKPQIDEHHAKMEPLQYPNPWQDYVRDNFGFLADAMEQETGDFKMGPLDIVSIWSYAHGTGFKPRYKLASMVANSYASRGSEMRGIPRHYHERGEFPSELKEEPVRVEAFRKKLVEIRSSLKELRFYVDGTNDSWQSLINKIREGDTKAEKELELMVERQSAYGTPVLSEITENWGNGFSILFLQLEQ